MTPDILQAMGDAVATLFQWRMLSYLFLGAVIGTLLAVLPGVGGLMGLALLLPFTFSMPAGEAIIFVIAALAVMSTADSMVTVLDGYPMAKRGEAGRTMGAAFTSSVPGIIPAVGPTVIPRLVHSYSTMATRGKSSFGQGDVRGVIASESSNNATVGDALLPTVALGVPGSAPTLPP